MEWNLFKINNCHQNSNMLLIFVPHRTSAYQFKSSDSKVIDIWMRITAHAYKNCSTGLRSRFPENYLKRNKMEGAKKQNCFRRSLVLLWTFTEMTYTNLNNYLYSPWETAEFLRIMRCCRQQRKAFYVPKNSHSKTPEDLAVTSQ